MHFAVDTERPTFAKVKITISIMFNYKTYKCESSITMINNYNFECFYT